MIEQIETYLHHGNYVSVRTDLKGKYKEYCLCYSCNKFYPEDRKKNCPIANAVYELCVLMNIVAPVWECKEFEFKYI